MALPPVAPGWAGPSLYGSGPYRTGVIGESSSLRNTSSGVDLETGQRYIQHTWTGIPEDIWAKYIEFHQNQRVLRMDVSHSDSLWQLVVRVDDSPETPVVVDNIKMVTNVVQKDILERGHPESPLIARLSSEQIAKIRFELKNYSEEKPLPNWSPFVGSALEDMVKTWMLLTRGVKYKMVFQPILTKTTSQSNRFAFQNSYNNVGNIIVEELIRQDAGIAALDRFVLPTRAEFGGDIAEQPIPNGSTTEGGYQHGWLKLGPHVELGPDRTQVLNQDYQWGLWPVELYTIID